MGTLSDDPNPEQLATDEAQLAAYADALADAVEAALPAYVARAVYARLPESAASDPSLRAQVDDAGARARDELAPAVRALLARDIDDQATNPLSILRRGTVYPTEVLASCGVPPVARDADARRLFPDDVYDLTPGSFADIDASLHEPGLLWGAAKAHVHLARRRREGRR